MRNVFASLLLAPVLLAQPITWRFTDNAAFQGCPTQFAYPSIADGLGMQFTHQLSANGNVTIQWRWFDANMPVVLMLSTDLLRNTLMPCWIVPPDVVLSGVTNHDGSIRWTWNVPTSAPLSVVPLGITLLGSAQVLELSTIPPTVSSYVVDIEAMR